MNRLTIRNSDDSVSQPTDLNWSNVLEKLAVYEDIGLEPEEVTKLIELRKRNTEILCGLEYERFTEILNAESEGRLLILPCKVGTRVYIEYCQFIPVCCDRCISGHGFDSDCDYFEKSQEYCRMELQHDKFGRTMGIASKRFTYDMIPQFGKTVFLTRKEAEEALKKESET